jgi:hypothetical protein
MPTLRGLGPKLVILVSLEVSCADAETARSSVVRKSIIAVMILLLPGLLLAKYMYLNIPPGLLHVLIILTVPLVPAFYIGVEQNSRFAERAVVYARGRRDNARVQPG